MRCYRTVVMPSLFACVVLFSWGLYLAFVDSPQDYLQGEMVRVMFVHVPAASLSLGLYVGMACASGMYLIFKHPLAWVAAKSIAPIGATFAGIALLTGAVWGKPTWGTYWIWDARIISTFVLFLLYLGYIALWHVLEDLGKAATISSIMALVGVVNVPIVRFSVVWWSTLHQGTSFGIMDRHIHEEILWPFLVMMAAHGMVCVVLILVGMRTEILERKLEGQRRRMAREERIKAP